MLRKGIVCTSLLAVSIIASAANWKAVTTTHRTVVTMDTTSIVRSGNLVKVWTKINYTAPTVRPEFGHPVTMELMHLSVDCPSHTVAVEDHNAYDANGTTIGSSRGWPNEFHNIVPGSVADSVHGMLCN
jgi:hypothetical protein